MNSSILYDAAGLPIRPQHGRLLTAAPRSSWGAKDLIRHAKENPPEPVIEGILNVKDILLIHGSEESFKSVLVLQMAENIAMAQRFLRLWRVPKPHRVGVIETEIHEVMLGGRLACMFPNGDAPENLRIMAETPLRDWRRQSLDQKFRSIQGWINEEKIDVLIIDTANDFFRGADNPSEERAVGKFFDELRNLSVGARIIVRHDRKKKGEGDEELNSNERIRGSAEWKEDPESIISLERVDRRTHRVAFEVGKLW